MRLYDQRLSYDEAYATTAASEDSATLYLAVACLDYRQLFDMNAAPQARSAQFAHALATLPASTFRPFTTAEWVAMDQNTETYGACLQWPARQRPTAPVLRRPLLPAATPVLVLGGELDTWTPPSEVVGTVLGELGGHSRFVEMRNSTHVVGEGDTGCAARLIRAFISKPSAVGAIPARCAQTIPPIRAVGVYAERLGQQPPLVPLRGIHVTRPELRLAGAAIATAVDAVRRSEAIRGSLDHGLNGGAVRGNHDATRLTLIRDELIPGIAVSGRIRVTGASPASDPDTVAVTVRVDAKGLPPGHLSATWPLEGQSTPVIVSGRIGVRRIIGTIVAAP